VSLDVDGEQIDRRRRFGFFEDTVAKFGENVLEPLNRSGDEEGASWSPDGASILQVPNEQSADAGAVLVLDASTGERRTIGWTGDFGQGASWQRTVPQS